MKLEASVDISFDVNAPKRILGNETLWKFAAQRWHVHYFEYVPMDTGNLAKMVRYSAKPFEGTVTHVMRYAHRQYTGNFNFSVDKHPLACNHWDQAAAATKLPVVAREVQAYAYRLMKKGNGNGDQ